MRDPNPWFTWGAGYFRVGHFRAEPQNAPCWGLSCYYNQGPYIKPIDHRRCAYLRRFEDRRPVDRAALDTPKFRREVASARREIFA